VTEASIRAALRQQLADRESEAHLQIVPDRDKNKELVDVTSGFVALAMMIL